MALINELKEESSRIEAHDGPAVDVEAIDD